MGDDIEAALLKHYMGHASIAMVVLLEWLKELHERNPDGHTPTVEQCLVYLEALGDLQEWWARRNAERHAADLVVRERARVAALWAAQGYPAAECWARAADGPPGPDPEILAALAEVKAELAKAEADRETP